MTRSVVALGGNTLLRGGEGTIDEQRERIAESAAVLSRLRDRGHDLVLTHGNGPQVGNLLLQQEEASGPEMPLDVLVAETQAQIGYLLQQELDARFEGRTVSIVTRSTVDTDDPAFDEPTKPIGPYYSQEEAESKPFETVETTTEEGETVHQRVVPSPRPQEILEADQIAGLADSGATVVCGGGGGVPVLERDDELAGVEAVIDKDYTSALVARTVDAENLLFLTDVDCAYVNFGEPDQEKIGDVTAPILREHLLAGEFGEGSMQPKVEACIEFVEAGGDRAIITSPDRLPDALDGEAGTRVHG